MFKIINTHKFLGLKIARKILENLRKFKKNYILRSFKKVRNFLVQFNKAVLFYCVRI